MALRLANTLEMGQGFDFIELSDSIKVAKFNREEYNNAFNQLKGNGGLNELAVLLGEEEKDVLAEIETLEKEGVICGYHTLINWEKTTKDKGTNLNFKKLKSKGRASVG